MKLPVRLINTTNGDVQGHRTTPFGIQQDIKDVSSELDIRIRVVSDADCSAVEPGFEPRRRHGCLCIGPSRHEGTLNSRRASNPLVRLMEGEERWEAPDPLRVFSLKIGMESSMLLKAKVNDKRKNLALRLNEFRGT
ncbi:hypothetical protein TNCV_3552071 [Trichonephila clavipes]|nr:hypothetical protein TNCV_3552071 [Trichonephila clavipes]